MNDLDAIRARHVPCVDGNGPPCGLCHICRDDWPCDTAIVLAALETAQVEFTDTMGQYEEYSIGPSLIRCWRRSSSSPAP